MNPFFCRRFSPPLYALLAIAAFVAVTALKAQQAAPGSSATGAGGGEESVEKHPQPAASSGQATEKPRKDSPRDVAHSGARKAEQNGGGIMDAAAEKSGPNFGGDPAAGLGSGGTGSADWIGDAANGSNGVWANQFAGKPRSFIGARDGFGAGIGPASSVGDGLNLSGSMAHFSGAGFGGHGGDSGGFVGAVPSFNPFMRGGLSLPIDSALGNFRLSYQNSLSLTNSFDTNRLTNYGSTFATYESPHARSGRIDFSAAAKVGMGLANGASSYGGAATTQNSFGIGRGPGGNSSQQPSSSLSFRLAF
jgi:hypothetical protein